MRDAPSLRYGPNPASRPPPQRSATPSSASVSAPRRRSGWGRTLVLLLLAGLAGAGWIERDALMSFAGYGAKPEAPPRKPRTSRPRATPTP